MKSICLLLVLAFLMPEAVFAQGSVVHVSLTLRMKNSEAPAPKDYYLDLGSRDGLKPGDVLTVSRLVAVPNAMWAGPLRAMQVPVAEVQVTYVGESSSISRVVRTPALELMARLDYAQVMVGDGVSLKTGLPSQVSGF